MAFGGGGNGQWVRTRNKAGAQSFLAEKRRDRDRLRASRARWRKFGRRIWSRLRRIFS